MSGDVYDSADQWCRLCDADHPPCEFDEWGNGVWFPPPPEDVYGARL